MCKNQQKDNNNFSTYLSVYHLPIKMTALDFVTDVNAPDDCCRNSGTACKHRQTIFILIYSEAAVQSSHKQLDENALFVCASVFIE